MERLLAVALVVLLLAGTASANTLRVDRSRRALLEHALLTATITASQPASRGAAAFVLDLALHSEESTDLGVVVLGADRGWSALAGNPTVLPQQSGIGIALVRQIDCHSRVLAPTRLTLRLRVADRNGAPVQVPIQADPAVVVPNDDRYCGRVDLMHSLVAVSSDLSRVGTRSTVALDLGNISLRPLVLKAFRFNGFRFLSSRPLPFTIAARAPGVLDVSHLRTYPLVLDARIADCEDARGALKEVVEDGSPNLLPVRVTDGTLDTLVVLDIRGLEAYLEAEWRSSCG